MNRRRCLPNFDNHPLPLTSSGTRKPEIIQAYLKDHPELGFRLRHNPGGRSGRWPRPGGWMLYRFIPAHPGIFGTTVPDRWEAVWNHNTSDIKVTAWAFEQGLIPDPWAHLKAPARVLRPRRRFGMHNHPGTVFRTSGTIHAPTLEAKTKIVKLREVAETQWLALHPKLQAKPKRNPSCRWVPFPGGGYGIIWTREEVKDYMAIGVFSKTPLAEKKAAFRRLALVIHPDLSAQTGIPVDEATEEFKLLKMQYDLSVSC